MTATILDGTKVAKRADQVFQETVQELKQHQIIPGLAVILVGDNPASAVYVRNKQRRAEKIGLNYQLFHLPVTVSQDELLELIQRLNQDPQVDGLMVQMPLPAQIDAMVVMNTIAPEKDVDGFSIANVGRLWSGMFGNFPGTPRGIMRLLHEYQVPIAGQHAVVIGRSDIVGKPMAALLLRENATVTIAHSHTRDLRSLTRQADILVVAVGQAGLISGADIKPGAVVVDVGMNRNEAGKLVGDIDFPSVAQVAKMVTPVPGGVGPMTITGLLEQVVTLAQRRVEQND
ncbi:bifunctional methylenetetrahydrofolate dehydrogenase/methenyltetrahydrofolate cyclohydrolase FolD [Lactobacillus sp. DCY120]|uniref:Bifunctional protein FolD n=1 Tax=Bombilactobacillus apium TaxID=2675299 RepID=A0A850QYN4_9LACO|nr:bifunctional methylenetetrahydrofolate dehydrogenase/methenyltetrahydrofolate cyclohydrolase FolD [Bombilactobacillus apium]NVY96954.1 bifunctional methylenetetrahydrofolate dehydrogenase/methenyltetrahydrofolate cyclohydrolase FolD [Bombilactobacillus apium]